MSTRGKFIVIEGIDGSGKSTQARRLFERITNEAGVAEEPICMLTSQPWPIGRIGSLIYEVLRKQKPPFGKEAMALLFAADRLDHVENHIRPALEDGTHVICDRYVPSSLTYQAEALAESLIDDGPHVWVEMLNHFALTPDLTIILDTPEEVARARRAARGAPEELYEQQEFQSRVAIRYAMLTGGNIIHVSGAAAEDEIAETIWNIFKLFEEEKVGVKQ